MVTIIDDEYSGNVFGRLGKGIGKGLSEQIPKEIDRYRLSKGLEKFEKESKGLTPIQQFTRLAAIPGITPEHLYTLSPLLKQQAQRDEATDRTGGKEERPTNVKQALQDVSSLEKSEPYSEQTAAAGEKRPLKSLEATQAQLTPIVRKSPEEMFSEAALLSQQNPNTYPTPADALPFIQANEETRVANLNEQRNVADVADAIQERIKGRLQGIWGKEATSKGIPGTVQTKLARNIEDELADPSNKLSEQQLIDKWAEVGKRIAKANTNLDARSKYGWMNKWGLAPVELLTNKFTGNTPQKILDTIETTKKVYKDADALEEFQDEIADKFNLTSTTSSYLTYSPENSDMNRYIKSVKVPSPSLSQKYSQDVSKLSNEAADHFSSLIKTKGKDKDNDSILSYALEIKKKGLDPDIFFKRMKQNADAGLFTPNSRQLEDLQKGYPKFHSLGDAYLFALLNKESLVE